MLLFLSFMKLTERVAEFSGVTIILYLYMHNKKTRSKSSFI